METKAENPIATLEDTVTHPILRAYFELCQLKQLYRQGWLRRGLPAGRCETVAEHSFGAALLTLWLAQACYPELDAHKALVMALLHDFGEIYAGDIIPGDPVSAAEKSRLEAQSAAQVLGKLPNGAEYLALWEEFEAGESPEARLVRQVDRLEMGLQAGVYARQGLNRAGEFYASARQALEDPALADLLEELWKND